MTLKVIGAGFGRTGTTSLKAALEMLGFAPCDCTQDIWMSRRRTRLWYDTLTSDRPDWHRLFEGYQSTVDWPGCAFYQELADAFPEAKLVLTVRDPEKWYDSFHKIVYWGSRLTPFTLLSVFPHWRRLKRMNQDILFGGTFQGQAGDRDHAIQTFQNHNEKVRRTIPAERLLVYQLSEGWDPLCQFLNVPVPDQPFPHLNDKKTTLRFMMLYQIIGWGALLAVIGGVSWLLAG